MLRFINPLRKNGRKKKMKDSKVTFNSIPHYVASDYRSGKLKRNDMLLLFWLRAIGNPYGVAITSLDALRDDLFPDLKKNTVNVMLIRLHQKRYIFFEPRQGKKGSFEIHLNHWKTPNGYKTLERFFGIAQMNEGESDTNDTSYSQSESSEDSQKSEVRNQMLNEMKKQLTVRLSTDSNISQIRSSHNEHDKDYQNKNNGTLAFKRKSVNTFVPQSSEEEQCRNIAIAIGEDSMSPILSVLRKDGIRRIEHAWSIYQKHKEEGRIIEDPRKYFQGIINNLRRNNE